MGFKKFNEWLNENKDEKITVLYPGGLKPMHGGHLSLIKRYASHPMVENVRVIVGPKTRNGISQEIGVQIAEILTRNIPNVTILPRPVSISSTHSLSNGSHIILSKSTLGVHSVGHLQSHSCDSELGS